MLLVIGSAGPAHGGSVGGSIDLVAIVKPQISGTAQVGQVLSCSQGTWGGSYTYSYQWNRNGVPTSGATSPTYVVTAADVGQPVTCTVTAIYQVGDFILGQGSATSDPVVPTAASGSPGSTPGQLTPLPSGSSVIRFPSSKSTCASKRHFRVHVRQISGVVYASATVLVNGKRIKAVQGKKLSAPIDLRGLPAGKFTVKITVATTDGRTLSGSRKYRTCSPKRSGSKRPRL